MARELVMPLTTLLRDILWACYTYSLTEDHLREEERFVCFSWVERVHRSEFGRSMHNGHMRQLAKLGFLTKGDTSRQGNRRYYRITQSGQEEAQRTQPDRGSGAGRAVTDMVIARAPGRRPRLVTTQRERSC
jgi:hypothetical protein